MNRVFFGLPGEPSALFVSFMKRISGAVLCVVFVASSRLSPSTATSAKTSRERERAAERGEKTSADEYSEGDGSGEREREREKRNGAAGATHSIVVVDGAA